MLYINIYFMQWKNKEMHRKDKQQLSRYILRRRGTRNGFNFTDNVSFISAMDRWVCNIYNISLYGIFELFLYV